VNDPHHSAPSTGSRTGSRSGSGSACAQNNKPVGGITSSSTGALPDPTPEYLVIKGQNIEVRSWGTNSDSELTLVLLHEGLGCVALWRDFPQQLAESTGCRVFAYSRAGYGQSDACELPRPLDYMSREATEVLPQVLDLAGIKRCVLIGHSDGATIAAVYSGTVEDHRVRGLVLMAPHFFTEVVAVEEIARAKVAFEETDLKIRMARYHRDPEVAFRGWNDAWLAAGFREWNVTDVIDYIRVPLLAIQGVQDQYGTQAQIDMIAERIYSPLETQLLDDCRHSPHLEQPEVTLNVVSEFIDRLNRIESG